MGRCNIPRAFAAPDRLEMNRIEVAAAAWDHLIQVINLAELLDGMTHETASNGLEYTVYDGHSDYIDRLLARAVFKVMVVWIRVFREDWTWDHLLGRR